MSRTAVIASALDVGEVGPGGLSRFADIQPSLLAALSQSSAILRRAAEPEFLDRVWKKIRKDRASGMDGRTKEDFQKTWPVERQRITDEILNGTYVFQDFRRVMVPKGDKQRPTNCPTIHDAIITGAVARALSELVLDRLFHPGVCAYRRGKGTATAIQRIFSVGTSAPFFFTLDIQSYFPSIPTERLLEELRLLTGDRAVVGLLARRFSTGVSEDGIVVPVEGVPQGDPVASLLANFWLYEEDYNLATLFHPGSYVRYSDNIGGRLASREEAGAVEIRCREILETKGLAVKKGSVERPDLRKRPGHFLGWGFDLNTRFISRHRLERLKAQLEACRSEYIHRPLRGRRKVANLLRGAKSYFKGANNLRLLDGLGRETEGYFPGTLDLYSLNSRKNRADRPSSYCFPCSCPYGNPKAPAQAQASVPPAGSRLNSSCPAGAGAPSRSSGRRSSPKNWANFHLTAAGESLVRATLIWFGKDMP